MKTINTLKSLPTLGETFSRDNNRYVTMKDNVFDTYCLMSFSGGQWYMVTSNEDYDSLCYSNLARMPEDLLEEVTTFEVGDEFVINYCDDFDSQPDYTYRYKIIWFAGQHYLLTCKSKHDEWVCEDMWAVESLKWPHVIRCIHNDVNSVIVHLQ